MSYKSDRDKIYTDEGIETIVHILEKGTHLTKLAGSFVAGRVMPAGNSFTFYNCIDWLVERKRLIVVGDSGRGQDMILRVNLREY